MKKVLFMAKLPPPLTGATKMSKVIADSSLINNSFVLKKIHVSFANSVDDLGTMSLRKFYRFFKYIFQLLNNLIFFKPDLVYFTLTRKGVIFFRDAVYVGIMKLFGKKVVIHLHGIGIKDYARKHSLINYIYKITLRNCYIICLSHLVVPDIEDVYSKKPIVINYGIEDNNIGRIVTKKSNVKKRILFLSNYMKLKGVYEFVLMMKKLDDRGIDFEAHMVGNSSDVSQSDLEEYVKQNKMENKVFVEGPKYGNDKYEEIINSDIFVFPTLHESFGVVALEAMQFGLPVVASNTGSLPHIIKDSETGFLAEKGNVDDFTAKIIQLLNDDNLRLEFGRKGRKRFEELFTVETFENNVKSAFDLIVEK